MLEEKIRPWTNKIKTGLASLVAFGLISGAGCEAGSPRALGENNLNSLVEDASGESNYGDEEKPVYKTIVCFPDKDGDGYGIKEQNIPINGYNPKCPESYADNPLDCNDNEPSIHPNAPELCNNVDDDCDKQIDEEIEPETCYSLCGEGKIYCSEGKWSSCNAPLPQEEVCNGKDDDCNGLTDELSKCCLSGDKINKIICPTGEIKEADLCINYEKLVHQVYLPECPCTDFKWVCLNQNIGKVCITKDKKVDWDSFYELNPADNNNKESCLPQWCCEDLNKNRWGCENGQNYLKETCSCISTFGGYENNIPFFSFSQECPSYEHCGKETQVNILITNHKTLDFYVWINWEGQGIPPTTVKVSPGERAVMSIDSTNLTADGVYIQLCTSNFGCAPKKPKINCGDDKNFTIDWTFPDGINNLVER
ncbi:MAG: putative metal-binding motif-containing protein [Nanoarchaeota archaeon]